MTQQINETLPELMDALRKIKNNSKHREKEELIPVLEELSWFDNFSEKFYRERSQLLEELKNEVETK